MKMFDSNLVLDLCFNNFQLFYIKGGDSIEDTMQLQIESLCDHLLAMFFVSCETLDYVLLRVLDIRFQVVHYINYLMKYVDQL